MPGVSSLLTESALNELTCRPQHRKRDINYSLYASEVGAESKNSSIVTPVTCFDVNGELQTTVRRSRGKTLENQPKSIGLAFPLLTSMKSLSGVTKSISCSFEAQKPIASGFELPPRTLRRQISWATSHSMKTPCMLVGSLSNS